MITGCVCGIIIGSMCGYYEAKKHKCSGYCEACEGDPGKRPITIVYAVGGAILGAMLDFLRSAIILKIL